MPRRHRPPESAHVMRWMVSWADFITLLFAFFVVMYAISSVNEKKFDAVATALMGMFEGSNLSTLPVSLEAIFPQGIPINDAVTESLQPDVEADFSTVELSALPSGTSAEAEFQQNLHSEFQPDEYTLMAADNWLHLEFPADALFQGDTDIISDAGAVTLNRLAKLFGQFSNAVDIEALSASAQVNDISDENLWQLSALQAAAVTYHLIMEGVDPGRLAAVGYGPYQPIATNDDEEGQALNRRLVFLIDLTAQQRSRIKTVTKRHLSAKPNR